MVAEPRWLTFAEIVTIQAGQIGLFGGLPGVRDENLIHSAIAKPRNSHLYDDEKDVLALAVTLGVGLARNHGFLDGNKRTGLTAMLAFLRVNGYRLDAPDNTFLGRFLEAVLTHDMTETEFADHVSEYVIEDED